MSFVDLGHTRRYFLRALGFMLLTFFLACQKPNEAVHLSPDKDESRRINNLVSDGDWESIAKLAKGRSQPVYQLLQRRAFYELKDYDKVLAAPTLKDPRFAPFDEFLKILSAFESKKWDQVLSLSAPDDLPTPLLERTALLKADAHREKKDFTEARKSYEHFLKDFRVSPFTGDVLFKLAEVDLELKDQPAALDTYEKIYRFHPIEDGDDLARQKLVEAGLYDQIDTDIHLSRIVRLQKAARFKRAEKELSELVKITPADQKDRVELALARLQFAQRNYSKSEKLARKVVDAKSAKNLTEWKELLASSLTRQSKHEEGSALYESLLKDEISVGLKEVILYRLGMIALDDENYPKAAEWMDKLRTEFKRGRYRESAHWFEAWALLQIERTNQQEVESKRKPVDLDRLGRVRHLLTTLDDLPAAESFIPQSLYWRGIAAAISHNPRQQKEFATKLHDDYSSTIYTLFLKDKPFDFLKSRKINPTPLPSQPSGPSSFTKNISWQRLEAFRSVGLLTWAKLELDRFLQSNRKINEPLAKAVARRLNGIEDYSDLVRWVEKYLDRPVKELDIKDPIVQLHYPLAYPNYVVRYASEFNVSPFLVWGVMREESRYATDALSKAGAVGLMQLMPFRAERVARALGDSERRKNLLDPKVNIRLGTYHLSELRKQMNSFKVSDDLKVVLQIASYNAGIEAVGRWLKEKNSTDVAAFIESIPYSETRQYVKRVLQSAYIYYRLYGADGKEVARTRSEEAL